MLRFNLHQVSTLLNIPTSTLRYWDKQGLIQFERDCNNQYRKVSLHCLANIIDVMEFRDMDIAIEQVRQTPQMHAEALLALLAENKCHLGQKIQKIQQTIEKIELKQRALERLLVLKHQPLKCEVKQLTPIYAVDIYHPSDVKHYLIPGCSADIISPNKLDKIRFGMFTPNHKGKQLRKGDSVPKSYLVGLMIRHNPTNTNNLVALIDEAESMGYKVNEIICQFLAFAYYSEVLGQCDHFEIWFDVDHKR